MADVIPLKREARETLEPQLDWILLRKLDHEEKTKSGLILPTSSMGADVDWMKSDRTLDIQRREGTESLRPKHASEATGRYEVLSVGPGDYVDYADETGKAVFLRKPLQTRVGETVLVRAGAREIFLNGESLWMVQDHMVLASVVKTDDDDIVVPKHDFVFCAPASHVAMSRGGIAMPDTEDFTGNVRFGGERYEVLGCGAGPTCLLHERGKPPGFTTRPMPVQPGDQFCAHGVGFGVVVKGAAMTVLQSFQIAAVFHPAAQGQA